MQNKEITEEQEDNLAEDLMNQMRSTVILAGALIGRFKEAKFSYPGRM